MAELIALEARLTALGREIDWPATPELSSIVSGRLKAPLRLPRRLPWYQSRLALAAAAVLVALAALLAYTPSRDAMARFLNLHTLIQRSSQLPTPSPLPPGPLGQRLGLGGQTTLAGARGKVQWHLLVPAGLGQPDEVYYQSATSGPPQGEVTLVYATAPGITPAGQTGVAVLVTEARGSVDANFFGKIIGNGTTLDEVTIDGHAGYWIAGQPHVFFLIDAAGNTRDETLRLATNTLIIDYNGTVIRIEGNMTRDQALAIAHSLT